MFILPCWFDDHLFIREAITHNCSIQYKDVFTATPLLPLAQELWFDSMLDAEAAYNIMIAEKWTPQQARSVLPNSLKAELIVTGNVREWRHFFKLRTAKDAHPQMQEVANMALALIKEKVTVLFDDI